VTRWNQGRATIDALIATGEIERVPASQQAAEAELVRARKHVGSAQMLLAVDPEGAYTLAYDVLSGTPVENSLSVLWALLDWTTPGLLGPLLGEVPLARPARHRHGRISSLRGLARARAAMRHSGERHGYHRIDV
jgi:hypothetical protein